MPRRASVDGHDDAGIRPPPAWLRGLRRWRVRLGRWRARDRERRGLLLRAGALVLVFRAALRLLSFSRVMSMVERMSAGAAGLGAGVVRPETVGHEVETAARILAPDRPCLPQALACCVLLRRAGHPAELHVGVRRASGSEDGQTPPTPSLEAHAWVECRGRIVAGGEPGDGASASRYTPLLVRFPGRREVGDVERRGGDAPVRGRVDEATAPRGGGA